MTADIRRWSWSFACSDIIIIACIQSHNYGAAHTAGSHYGFRATAKLKAARNPKKISTCYCSDGVVGPQLLAAQLALRHRSDQRLRFFRQLQLQLQVRASLLFLVKQASADKHSDPLRATANSMDCRAHGKVQPHTGAGSCRPDTLH